MHLILGKVLERQTDFVAPTLNAEPSEEDSFDPAEEEAEEVSNVMKITSVKA